jgi:MFS family permease
MDNAGARRTLVLVSVASLLAMSSWFSGTVVLPELGRLWQADLGLTSWLTMAVQLGFVAGGLLSAVFNLPDHFSATRVFVVSSLGAAAVNAAFAAVAAEHAAAALVLRFLTGAFLAGVYPPAMKILASWYRDGRGTALGILIGALTVGSALPHAVRAAGNLPWREVVLSSSGFALLGAVVVALGVHEGPYRAAQPPFDAHQVYAAFRNRRLRLANFGYFGHMWELYSMWGWIALLLAASAGQPGRAVAAASFLAIAIGAIGCVWAGRASDAGVVASPPARIARRSLVTIVAMAASGACCLLAALVFEHFWLLVVVCLVWGIAVIADSAQFSTIVSEVADHRYVGTALTVQTAAGFLLTVLSLRVVGAIGAGHGWRWAAVSMAIGPALGAWAMWRLERQPEPEEAD